MSINSALYMLKTLIKRIEGRKVERKKNTVNEFNTTNGDSWIINSNNINKNIKKSKNKIK